MSGSLRRHLDWAIIVAVNFMWATQAPVIKLMGDRLGPVAITFLPMFLSIAVFLPALLVENRRRGTGLRVRGKDAVHFIVAGLCGQFLLQLTYTLGAQRTLAANAGIITLSIPVLVAVAASLMLREKLNTVRVASFALTLAGVLLTSLQDLRGANFTQPRYLAGNLLFLGACAASAFYNTYCKLLVEKHYTELEILVYTSVVGAAAALPLFVWMEPLGLGTLRAAGVPALWGILELGLVVYGAAMLLFFAVLRRLDVTQASLGNYLLPFFIGVLAVVVLGESITAATLAGGVLVLAGTLMVSVYEAGILRWLARRAST